MSDDGVRLCDHCHKPIDNPRVNQRFHQGECRVATKKLKSRAWYWKIGRRRLGRGDHNGAASPTLEYPVRLAGWRTLTLWTV